MCRYGGQAKLVSIRRDKWVSAVVTFDSLPGRLFSTSWAAKAEPDIALLTPGASIDAEVWNGKITKLGGVRTADSPYSVPSGLWELTLFFTLLGLPLLVFGVRAVRSAGREQGSVVPVATASTLTQLSPRSRYAIFAALFLVAGTPMTVFLLTHARSGFELAYRAIAGVVLFAIGVSLAWRAWQSK